MKAKPIFYLNGNNRRFEDQHTISVMTGEPMPRKWQEFFELTPEEKARWDASLKLDEEYRIAEAQGFPNGIPGGKTRGDMLHYLTQQEEAHKRSMQERNFFDQSFISDKAEIQRNNNIMSNNTLIYGQSNTQLPFAFNQKSNTESPYARQNNLSQMNTGIKKEPAFDVKQAIRKLADRLRAMGESAEEQTEKSLPVMNGQDNDVMPVGASSSVTQTVEQKYDIESIPVSIGKDSLEQWGKNLEKDDYVILGDENEDGLVMPRKEFVARYSKKQPEVHNLVQDRNYNRQKVNIQRNDIGEKRYNIIREVKLSNGESVKVITEESVLSSVRPVPDDMTTKNSIKSSDIGNEVYDGVGNNVYEHASFYGEGVFLAPNLDLLEEYLEKEMARLKKDLDQVTIDFFGSVEAILAMCPKDSRLAKLGARLGYALLAIAAFRCVLDVQRRREKLINELVAQGRQRRDAEAETLPIYHRWLLDEIKNLVLEDWISDILPLIFIPQEDTENKGSLMI